MASRRFRSILDGADPAGAHLRVPEGWVVDSNSGRLKRAGQLSEAMLHYL